MAKRTTFSFSKDVDRLLNDLAEHKDTTKTEILRRAITLYDYLEKNREGGTVKIEKPSGEKVEIVLP
jgi:predicted transcriptional regulator